MKVKEYVTLYKLDKRKYISNKDREDFCNKMLNDMKRLYRETHKDITPALRFKRVTTEIREKWDSVFNKSMFPYEYGDKFFKYFFASRVVAFRDYLFEDWKKALKEEYGRVK